MSTCRASQTLYNTHGRFASPKMGRRAHRAFHVKQEPGEGTLGSRIRQARLALSARLSPPRLIEQRELAEWMEVSPSAVSNWEQGRKEPNLATIERIAVKLGVRAEWLAFGRGPMDVPGPNSEGGVPPRPDPRTETGGEYTARRRREKDDEDEGGKQTRPRSKGA
jgi:transcriptional regulator with XRE-family HTH domain